MAGAQESFVSRFTAHNSNLGALQPSWIVPLVTPDPRLIQYGRVSVSHEYTAAHAETVNFGNGRGFGVISGNRFEFDYVPPAYIQHNTAGAMDGFGDTSTLVKYRIASGNAKHGNFDVAAMLSHSFATGSYKNGAVTDSFSPTVAGGFAHGRFDVISSGAVDRLECCGAVSRIEKCVVRVGEQCDVLLQRGARRQNAELCCAGGILRFAAQGVEIDASFSCLRCRDAGGNVGVPHV
jgi:hypothetical protein